jgi:iron complex transport system substrate-binding protein
MPHRPNRAPSARVGALPGAARRWAAAAAALALLAGCAAPAAEDPRIVPTTEKVFKTKVLGIDRETSRACAAPTAPDDPAPGTHPVPAVPGAPAAPNDPRRIVTLDAAALDAVCALGLADRVVGAVTLGGEHPQPTYLGPAAAAIASVGTGRADPALVAAARPDLILGGPFACGVAGLSEIAPTVLVPADETAWEGEFLAAAAALGRVGAGRRALAGLRERAAAIGREHSAGQLEGSIIAFDADGERVAGESSFPGQVLAATGTGRPAGQRGLAAPYEELGPDPSRADADVVYAIVSGADGLENRGRPGGGDALARAEAAMGAPGWYGLGAVDDERSFLVEAAVWQGRGVVAAHMMLSDLAGSLKGYAI